MRSLASLAGTLVAFETAPMRYLPTPLAGVRFPELKCVYLRRMVTNSAQPSLAFKAGLASVEMLIEYLKLALKVMPFMPVVDIVQILEAEQILLQAVVDFILEHVVHELGVADRVVHQMDLAAQNQELVQFFVAFYHRVVVAYLDDGFLIVAFDPFQSALRDIVAPEVEFLLGLVGYLDALLSCMVVAVPLAQVVAVVHIGAEDVETLAEWLFALEAATLVGAWLRTASVEEHLQLVAEFLVEEVLRVLEVSGFSLEVQLGSWLDWNWSCQLLGRVAYVWVGLRLRLDLLQRFLLLQQRFPLPELFQPLLLQLLLPYLLRLLRPQPFLQNLLLDLFDNRPQYLIDSHLECELLLSNFHQIGLKLLDIDGLDLDLPILEELELADIRFKGRLLLFAINVEVGQVVDDEVEDFEEPACLDEECKEDSYFLFCDFVDLIDDVGHFVQVLELLLELVPVAVDVALLEAVLVLHALLEDLHEAAQQDAELLVLGLLAEGELVGERLR